MNIKGSKVRFAIDAILAIASAVVAASLAWQFFTVEFSLQSQFPDLAGVLMGIAWTVVMALQADCHRRGLPEID